MISLIKNWFNFFLRTRNFFYHVNKFFSVSSAASSYGGAYIYAGSNLNAELGIIASSHKVIKEITSMILHLMRWIYGFMAIKVSIHLLRSQKNSWNSLHYYNIEQLENRCFGKSRFWLSLHSGSIICRWNPNNFVYLFYNLAKYFDCISR